MSIWNDIYEFFFPRYCVVCNKRLLQSEEGLCFHCLSGLPRTNMHLLKDNQMEKNFWGCFPLERATSFLYYTKGGDVRKLLYELKYYGNKHLGVELGRCMTSEMHSSGFFEGIDGIIPVPLHPKKKRIRGYNQSEVLAEGISSVSGIPVWNDSLIRQQFTDTQTRKSRFGRWENVNDVFVCQNEERLEDKHILLVDDVATTGATIVACADALKHIRGLRISVLTLAVVADT